MVPGATELLVPWVSAVAGLVGWVCEVEAVVAWRVGVGVGSWLVPRPGAVLQGTRSQQRTRSS